VRRNNRHRRLLRVRRERPRYCRPADQRNELASPRIGSPSSGDRIVILIGAENHAENYCRSAQPPQQKSSGAVFTGALLLLAGFVLSAAPAAVTRLLPATLILANILVRISHFKF